MLVDVSHVVEHGMVTYKGLPAPLICDFLSREQSRSHYAPGTEFHIGKIEMVANTGNLADAREHSQQGHCIAVDLGIVRRDGDLVPRTAFLGRPSKADVRKTYEEDMDPVSQARLDARKRTR